VAAESEEIARYIHPNTNSYYYPSNDDWRNIAGCHDDSWANHPSEVKVTLIGIAVNETESGVILTDFNAV
jgi:hypothetical protein